VNPIGRLKAAGWIALLGGGLSFFTLAGAMRDTHKQVITRAAAPVEFWAIVIAGARLVLLGGGLAIATLVSHRDDDGVAVLAGKAFQYAALGCVLAVIYSIYLRVVLRSPGDEAQFATFVKFGVASALPLALFAYTDERWSSNDAAPVCAAAWTVVFQGFVASYGDACPITAFLLFVPLVGSALVGHGVGKFCR